MYGLVRKGKTRDGEMFVGVDRFREAEVWEVS